jgi:hypothetical protein
MKIFVSSLITGFEPLRAAARSAIQALGHEPVTAEDFGAKPASPQVACLQGLRSADIVVLILGERYGAIPPGSRVSPTHEEYLEARDAKEILLFVQEGVAPEPAQDALLREAQGWRGGLFRAGFRTPEELRDAVTRAIHKFELAHAAAPLSAPELRSTAEAMLAALAPRPQGPSRLCFALAGGPKQQVLRPAELEAESLADALHQQAMFGTPKLFEKSSGVNARMDGDILVIEQENGASLRLDEQGGIAIGLPLEREASRSRGFGGVMLGIVEESVLRELTNAIAFADWVLDKIDPTQRVTHVGLAARIEASDFMAWRTKAEQDASPNSGTMRMSPVPEKPVCVDRPRGALKFDARRLAEDLLVPLRRQWKA